MGQTIGRVGKGKSGRVADIEEMLKRRREQIEKSKVAEREEIFRTEKVAITRRRDYKDEKGIIRERKEMGEGRRK